jgi:hypothetical protein
MLPNVVNVAKMLTVESACSRMLVQVAHPFRKITGHNPLNAAEEGDPTLKSI